MLVRPGVSCHLAPAGTIALIQHVEQYRFEVSQVPALALCEDAPRPEPLPELREDAPQPFLLEPQPGGRVELSEVEARFARVIAAAAAPVDAGQLAAALGGEDLAGSAPWETAEALLEAGVLREVEVGADGTVRPAREASGP